MRKVILFAVIAGLLVMSCTEKKASDPAQMPAREDDLVPETGDPSANLPEEGVPPTGMPARDDSLVPPTGDPSANLPESEMSSELCESAGGHWNECSSACLGTDAEVCTMQCVQTCECGGNAGWNCPEGYTCRLSGKSPDEHGACIRAA